MLLSVEERHLDVDYRISGDDTSPGGVHCATFYRRDKAPFDTMGGQAVHEQDFAVKRCRLHAQSDDRERSSCPGLLNDSAFSFTLSAYGLLVRHARLPNVRIHSEVIKQPVFDDLKMKLAHPADDELSGLRVVLDFECGVFS